MGLAEKGLRYDAYLLQAGLVGINMPVLPVVLHDDVMRIFGERAIGFLFFEKIGDHVFVFCDVACCAITDTITLVEAGMPGHPAHGAVLADKAILEIERVAGLHLVAGFICSDHPVVRMNEIHVRNCRQLFLGVAEDLACGWIHFFEATVARISDDHHVLRQLEESEELLLFELILFLLADVNDGPAEAERALGQQVARDHCTRASYPNPLAIAVLHAIFNDVGLIQQDAVPDCFAAAIEIIRMRFLAPITGNSRCLGSGQPDDFKETVVNDKLACLIIPVPVSERRAFDD